MLRKGRDDDGADFEVPTAGKSRSRSRSPVLTPYVRDANLMKAIENGNDAAVAQALADGGNGNCVHEWRGRRTTPILEALKHKFHAIAKRLLQHGHADVNVVMVDAKHKTRSTTLLALLSPPSAASKFINGSVEECFGCILPGLDPRVARVRDESGHSPLFYAARSFPEAALKLIDQLKVDVSRDVKKLAQVDPAYLDRLVRSGAQLLPSHQRLLSEDRNNLSAGGADADGALGKQGSDVDNPKTRVLPRSGHGEDLEEKGVSSSEVNRTTRSNNNSGSGRGRGSGTMRQQPTNTALEEERARLVTAPADYGMGTTIGHLAVTARCSRPLASTTYFPPNPPQQHGLTPKQQRQQRWEPTQRRQPGFNNTNDGKPSAYAWPALDLLLRCKVDVATARDVRGQTLLHALACSPNAARGAATRLAEAKCPLDARDVWGNTAMHCAMYSSTKHIEWFAFIAEMAQLGVPCESHNHAGHTPAHLAVACQNPEALEALMGGALCDFSVVNAQGLTVEGIELRRKNKKRTHTRTTDGRHPCLSA